LARRIARRRAVAIERAGEGNPLPLSGRQDRTPFADPRVVAGREPEDHAMGTGRLGSSDDGRRVG
jgi:hypothetical protein